MMSSRRLALLDALQGKLAESRQHNRVEVVAEARRMRQSENANDDEKNRKKNNTSLPLDVNVAVSTTLDPRRHFFDVRIAEFRTHALHRHAHAVNGSKFLVCCDGHVDA